MRGTSRLSARPRAVQPRTRRAERGDDLREPDTVQRPERPGKVPKRPGSRPRASSRPRAWTRSYVPKVEEVYPPWKLTARCPCPRVATEPESRRRASDRGTLRASARCWSGLFEMCRRRGLGLRRAKDWQQLQVARALVEAAGARRRRSCAGETVREPDGLGDEQPERAPDTRKRTRGGPGDQPGDPCRRPRESGLAVRRSGS